MFDADTTLPVLPPSFYLRGLAKYDIMLQGIPFRLFWGGFGAGRLRPAARSDRWITWWKVCGRAAKTPVTAGLFSPLLGESAFGDNVDNRFWGGQNRSFGARFRTASRRLPSSPAAAPPKSARRRAKMPFSPKYPRRIPGFSTGPKAQKRRRAKRFWGYPHYPPSLLLLRIYYIQHHHRKRS